MENEIKFEQSFIGTGFAYPPRIGLSFDGNGGIAMSSGDQDIAKSIFLILGTAPGERVMRPKFGCQIHQLVFSSPGPQTFGLIAYYIEQALGRWEPRIQVVEVRPSVHPQKPGELLINIAYTVRQTNSERNLVYPFYIIPREPE